MVMLFSPYVFCMLMAMAVDAEECGGTSGPLCNASLMYTTFESVYLAASTSDQYLGKCVRLLRQDGELIHFVVKFENGTQEYEDTDTNTYTVMPNVVNITFGNDPDTTHQVQIPYGDYEACFVAKFDDAALGCRLWISDNAVGSQITACMNGHVQACPGTIHDTWNEESCA